MTDKKPVPTLTKDQAAAVAKFESTAARVRYLLAQGLSRGDVSRVLGIRYQWVRNVDVATKATSTNEN